MTTHEVDNQSGDISNSDVVVNIDTSDSEDHVGLSQQTPVSGQYPTTPTQTSTTSTKTSTSSSVPPKPTLTEIKQLKNFKLSFWMGVLICLYFVFQIVYVSLHRFIQTYTFVLLILSLMGNSILFGVCFASMATGCDDDENPVKIFLTAFAFVNAVNLCQIGEIIGVDYSELSTKEQVLFNFNVILLILVGLACTLVAACLTLKFVGSRIGRWCTSLTKCICAGNFWTRFYKCCNK